MTQEDTPETCEAARRHLSDPEHRRLRAYHECGHAVWLFLDGREADILYIDIAPRVFGPGVNDFDSGVCAYGGDAYCANWVSQGNDRKESLARAARCVAFCFAGPVCECVSTGWNNPKELWEDALRYEWECQLDNATTFADNPRLRHLDFGVALQAAYAIFPTRSQRVDHTGPRRQRYLQRAVRWSVEVFSQPNVWQLVQAIAREFEPETVARVSGDRAREIIAEVWGENHEGIPLRRLGAKWQRHYGCEVLNG